TRAMPSPTDSTWPTSETSASWPKFLICSLRMAEISAARISILSSLFHRVPDRIELGAQRGVDHAAAELDHEPADDGGIDLDSEVDVLAADRLERSPQRIEMVVFELFCHGDLGRRLAFVLGHEFTVALDHVARREQPAVRRHQLEESRGKAADSGPVEHRRERLQLLFGGENRAAHQTVEIGAFGNECAEAFKVRFHRIDRVRLARE